MTRKRSFLLLIWLVCVALLTHATPALADKRVALVIGNANYKNTPALTNPANDATDVARALTAVGFEVTLAIDVDKRKMDQALADFARASTKADASLFYYAGHGMQFQGRNYIMPVDADLQDEISLRYEMTAIDEVKAAVERSNGVRVMVLDACRNNPLAQRFARSITSSTRDIPNVQGYARPEKTQGMVVAYATQADDVANDGIGRNSPFSAAFLKEIKEPGLEIGTMFRRIGEDVYQATNGRQSPELSISVVREYYLNQAETDQAIWARIRASADADTIREFLNRYPSSFFAPDAKARLDLLDDAAREKVAALQLEQQKAQAARLQQEQAAREKIAAEARAREQDLAAKLATAEAERQQMAAELAQKAAAQADADRRQQSDRAKAEDERQRREADLRAQIAQQQATASQMEKDRLLREALAKDGEKQKADEQARAERERVAKESAEKELQAQADRAGALKDKIAQLEQQAAAAQANVAAAEQKAADAQKAASQQLEQQRQELVAAEAGRLKQEQAERERIAADARAREQDLAAKLAAAEAERQRMAAQLADKIKAQGDADQRGRADRDLKEEADRAQALKAEIAQLEKDAAQARANVQVSEQNAVDAQKAASSVEKVAALTPTLSPSPHDAAGAEATALVLPIQAELRRLGCYPGVEPDWNSAAMKRGVAQFAQYAKLTSPPDLPSAALLDDLKGRRERVCPSECSPREVEVGGRCVARTCGVGEIVGRNGACVARPAAPRQAVANAAPKARAAAPAKGHCFSFNGNQYCE